MLGVDVGYSSWELWERVHRDLGTQSGRGYEESQRRQHCSQGSCPIRMCFCRLVQQYCDAGSHLGARIEAPMIGGWVGRSPRSTMWWELESLLLVFPGNLDPKQCSLVYWERQEPRLSAAAGGGQLSAQFIFENVVYQ